MLAAVAVGAAGGPVNNDPLKPFDHAPNFASDDAAYLVGIRSRRGPEDSHGWTHVPTARVARPENPGSERATEVAMMRSAAHLYVRIESFQRRFRTHADRFVFEWFAEDEDGAIETEPATFSVDVLGATGGTLPVEVLSSQVTGRTWTALVRMSLAPLEPIRAVTDPYFVQIKRYRPSFRALSPEMWARSPHHRRGGSYGELYLARIDEELSDRHEQILALLDEHIPKLEHARGNRWPILHDDHWGNNYDLLDAFLDRGLLPQQFGGFWIMGRRHRQLPMVFGARYMQNRGFPVIFQPQAIGHWLFKDNSNHLPEADPVSVSRFFTCPSILYERSHADAADYFCRLLRAYGVGMQAYIADVEDGTYLRTSAAHRFNVQQALEQAMKCIKCIDRFGVDEMDTVEEYQLLADAARAFMHKTTMSDPIHQHFPNCLTGSFFDWPINRTEPEPDQFPAYGFEGSGMQIAQPRVYFSTPVYGRQNQIDADWAVFADHVGLYSRCMKALGPGEVLVPRTGYVLNQAKDLPRLEAGFKLVSAEAYKETIRHTLLRGAKTVSVFHHGLLKDYSELPFPRNDLPAFFLGMIDVQSVYDELLAYREILEEGEPLNLEPIGDWRTRDEEHPGVWSGIGTADRALIRTVTFGREGTRTLKIYGKEVTLPFLRKGRYFLVYPLGSIPED
ncbi:MAG: hypothetical protein CMJ18_28010 [Phycisphaeraceae bacterium]|nr:hypothetical protein [Phycisphaeraceae bacterium]